MSHQPLDDPHNAPRLLTPLTGEKREGKLRRNTSFSLAAMPKIQKAFTAADEKCEGKLNKERFRVLLQHMQLTNLTQEDSVKLFEMIINAHDGADFDALTGKKTQKPLAVADASVKKDKAGSKFGDRQTFVEGEAGVSFFDAVDWYGTLVTLNDERGSPSKLGDSSTDFLGPQRRRSLSAIVKESRHHHHSAEASIDDSFEAHNREHTPRVTDTVVDQLTQLFIRTMRRTEGQGLHNRGYDRFVVELVQRAVANPNLPPERAAIDLPGFSTAPLANARTLAFTSALAIRHLHNDPHAHMPLDTAVLFIDISGYSTVSAMLEDGGPHRLAQVVNSYLDVIVKTVIACGGDIVKFAGDALVALWYADDITTNAEAATMCSLVLQQDCGRHMIPDSDLFFQLHIGVAEGTVYSRVFNPRKATRGVGTPTHFHFLSGEPMSTVTIACAAAGRGKIYCTDNVREQLLANHRFKFMERSGKNRRHLPKTAASPASPHLDLSGAPARLFEVLPGDRFDSSKFTFPKTPRREASASNMELGFIPPTIVQNIDAGIDQFYLAEMRSLVVFFIHCAGTTDEEIWFDEVHDVLETHGAACVQIIDDDKGVHVVAAINLYMTSHDSYDAAVELCSSLMSRVPDATCGVASGTVLCGVLGSSRACQWDITGPACVRACRLMQQASTEGKPVLLDESVYVHVNDKSRLLDPYSVRVKGKLGDINVCGVTKVSSAGSLRRSASMKYIQIGQLPDLYFDNALCPDVHKALINRVRDVIFAESLPGSPRTTPSGASGIHLRKTRLRQLMNSGIVSINSSRKESMNSTPNLTSTNDSNSSKNGSRDGHPEAVEEVMSVEVEEPSSHTVILHGAKGSGKFGICLNAIRGTRFIPIVHRSHYRQQHSQLSIAKTIASWFANGTDDETKGMAINAWKALSQGQANLAFKHLMNLLQVATRTNAFALIVTRVQFLDSGSSAFIGSLISKFAHCPSFCIMLTSYPTYQNPSPTSVFMAYAGVQKVDVEQLKEKEVQSLMKFVLHNPVTSNTAAFVNEKADGWLVPTLELTRYLKNLRAFTQLPSGDLALASHLHKKVTNTPWHSISQLVVQTTVHLFDFLPPRLRMLTKIIAAITEQPQITAFFFSVSRCVEIMMESQFNEKDAMFLEELKILRMTVHKCTAHTGGDKKDAAILYSPPMRDVIQGLLVPSQRVQINAICAHAYADTHPMNHPMQFLVRARHFRFADCREDHLTDIAAGWTMLAKGNYAGHTAQEQSRLQHLFRDWMDLFTSDELLTFMERSDVTYIREHRMKARLRHQRQRATSALIDDDHRWLATTQGKVFPLPLGPARDKLIEVVRLVRELSDFSYRSRSSIEVRRAEDLSSTSQGEDDHQVVNVTLPPSKLRDLKVTIHQYRDLLKAQLVPFADHQKACGEPSKEEVTTHSGLDTLGANHIDDDVESVDSEVMEGADIAIDAELLLIGIKSILKSMTDDVMDDLGKPPTDETCDEAEKLLHSLVMSLKTHCDTQIPELVSELSHVPIPADLFEVRFWARHIADALIGGPQKGASGDDGTSPLASPKEPRRRSSMREIDISPTIVLTTIGDVCSLLSEELLNTDRTALMLLYSRLPQIKKVLCGTDLQMQDSFTRGLDVFYNALHDRASTHADSRQYFVRFFTVWLRRCAISILGDPAASDQS